MSQLTVLPWMNRHEVRCVYRELYSSDTKKQKHALGRIAVWQNRAQHRMPLACESTAALVSAEIEYRKARLTEEDVQLRHLYSIALLRFLNHVTEKGQSKPYAVPVHILADQIGVPDWIVDIRHEATHGSLPSLCVLRAGAKWALNWLKTEFWEEQIWETEMEKNDDTEKLAQLRNLLQKYQQAMFRKAVENVEKEDNSKLLADLNKTIRSCQPSSVCECVTEDGFLVYTQQQLDSLGISLPEFLQSTLPVPEPVVRVWKKLIRILERNNMIYDLVFHLVSMVTNQGQFKDKVLMSWIFTLIEQCDETSVKNSKGALLKTRIELPHMQLLNRCLQMNKSYIKELVILLLSKVSRRQLDGTSKALLTSLVTLYCPGSEVMHLAEETDRVYSVQDIVGTEACKWKLNNKPFDWSRVPLGKLPNQRIGYKTLEIRDDNEEEDDTSDDQSNSDVESAMQIDPSDNENTENQLEIACKAPEDWDDGWTASSNTSTVDRCESHVWSVDSVKHISDTIHIF